MKLMCPSKILNSWGSSSREYFLRNFPKLVMRGSLSILNKISSRWFWFWSSDFFWSASGIIVRNL